MLEIEYSKQARRFLLRLPAKHAGQMVRKILSLTDNPFPSDSIYLKGFPYYRVDSGEYRIVYQVERLVLHIRLIGKRNDDEVYRKLKRLGGN